MFGSHFNSQKYPLTLSQLAFYPCPLMAAFFEIRVPSRSIQEMGSFPKVRMSPAKVAQKWDHKSGALILCIHHTPILCSGSHKQDMPFEHSGCYVTGYDTHHENTQHAVIQKDSVLHITGLTTNLINYYNKLTNYLAKNSQAVLSTCSLDDTAPWREP